MLQENLFFAMLLIGANVCVGLIIACYIFYKDNISLKKKIQHHVNNKVELVLDDKVFALFDSHVKRKILYHYNKYFLANIELSKDIDKKTRKELINNYTKDCIDSISEKSMQQLLLFYSLAGLTKYVAESFQIFLDSKELLSVNNGLTGVL